MNVREVCQAAATTKTNATFNDEVTNINDFLNVMDIYTSFLPLHEEVNTIGNLRGPAFKVFKQAVKETKFTAQTKDSPFKKAIAVYQLTQQTMEARKMDKTAGYKKIKAFLDSYQSLDSLWQKLLSRLSPAKQKSFTEKTWAQVGKGSSVERFKAALEKEISITVKALPKPLKDKLAVNALWFGNVNPAKGQLAIELTKSYALRNCPKYFPKPVEQKQPEKPVEPDKPKEPTKQKPSWFAKNVSLTAVGNMGYAYASDNAKENGLSLWGVYLQLKALAVVTPTPNTWVRADYNGSLAIDPAGQYQDKADYGLVNNTASTGVAVATRLPKDLTLYAEARYQKHYQDISTDLFPGGQSFIGNFGLSIKVADAISLQAIGTIQYEEATFLTPLKDDKEYKQVKGTATAGLTIAKGPSFTAANFIGGANEITDDPDQKLGLDEAARKALLGFSVMEQLKFDPITVNLKAAYINYNSRHYVAGQVGAFWSINQYIGLGASCATQAIDDTAVLICTAGIRSGYPAMSFADSNQPLPYSPSRAPLFIGDPLWQK